MDKLHIINRALMKCGLPLAASLNDCDWNAAQVFEPCAEECLRSHGWGFAQKFATLEKSAPPEHGHMYGYQLPDDCVRVIDIRSQFNLRSPKGTYQKSGNSIIYTDLSPCHLRYVQRLLDPAEWPVDFADAVACRIGYEIATLSAQTMALAPNLFQMFQVALSGAIANDGRENRERVPQNESVWISRAQEGRARR